MVKTPATSYLEEQLEKIHEWIYRYQEDHDLIPRPPRLLELEKLSELVAKFYVQNDVNTAKYNSEAHITQVAMNELRHVFNMEFKILCNVCGRTHYQDEISAPER